MEHRFLIHKRGDSVGVAVADIDAGQRVVGVYMDDDSTVEVEARDPVPLGHKIAVVAAGDGEPVLEYGIQIGVAARSFDVGAYVHTHNLRSARW